METAVKKCPICNKEKTLDNYYSYYSKQRNKYRVSNYCKPCARENSKPRAKKYFENNREEKLQYAKDYRADPNNKKKLEVLRKRFKKKYSRELKDCYLRDQLKRKHGIENELLHENPEIVEVYKNQLLIKRKLKQLKDGK